MDEPVETDPAEPDGSPVVARPPRRGLARLLPRSPVEAAVGVAALMFLAGSAGYAIAERADASPGRDSADVGFLYDMSLHHQQALHLANLELVNGADPDALRWARDILRAQAYEIGLMEMQPGQFGHDPADRPDTVMGWMGMSMTPATMPGLASAQEVDLLADATGAEADAIFYALMIDHHRGGVAMAEAAADVVDDDWVADTAAAMAAIQTSEIAEMSVDRDRAGLPASPAGVTVGAEADHTDHDESIDDTTSHDHS